MSAKPVSMPTEYRIFQTFGVELSTQPNGSGQYVGDCPFCEKSKHFYVGRNDKKFKDGDVGFSCERCGKKGNRFTFLRLIYEQALTTTTTRALQRLSAARKKFPIDAFTNGGVAYSPEIQRYLIPIRTAKGGYSALRTYDGQNGSPLMQPPGCPLHLFNLDRLQPSGPVALCEGEWDALALQHLLSKCQTQAEDWSVLSVPGASNLPDADAKLLKNRDVWLLYDNDQPGRDGMQLAIKKLAKLARSIHVISWPPNRFCDGYDISDLVREATVRPDLIFDELLTWCHRVETPKTAGTGPILTDEMPKLERNSIEEIVKDFKETGIHVYPGFRDALVLTLAIVESICDKGEPLWCYLIGPSGAGKSLILESTLASPQCIYRTAITHRSMLSGFKGESGDDPSLLCHLPGKALVVKDYSNVLALPHYEQDQLFSLLREAYDGRVVRGYGNNVYRQYPPPGSAHEDCKFSFVAGVTPDIYIRSHAALGERFLRFNLARSGADDLAAIRTAMDDSWRSHERAKRRAAAVAGFLSREGSREHPRVPQWFRNRIIALAQFVGYCRSHVSRTKEDLDYEPVVESGTRMAKQLLKLSISLARILGLKYADGEVYRLVRKVAWDTAHSHRRNIYHAIYRERIGECEAISKATGLSRSTVYRVMRDMHALAVLKKSGTRNDQEGRPRQLYALSIRAREVYQHARIGEMFQ